MKKPGISLASGLIRLFFILILIARVSHSCVVTLPAIYFQCFNCYDAKFLWVAAKVLVDLAFIVLVFSRFENIWVPPVTFFWLSIQTIVSIEGNSVTIEGLKIIALIFPFVILAGLAVGKIFNWSGIRGRILIVCLASACLPMFYLSLALIQQTRHLIENAFFPVAKRMIEADLKRLNSAILERANPDLMALLGEQNPASGISKIPLSSEAAYWDRAGSLTIPLVSVKLVFPNPEGDMINLDFQNIRLQFLLDILRKKFQISFGETDDFSAEKLVTLQAKGITLEQTLKQLKEIPDFSLKWENGNLLVSSNSEPGTASLRLVLGGGKNFKDPEFADFLKLLSKRKNSSFSSFSKNSPDAHFLELRVPERENGKIVKGLTIKIDLRKWIKKIIDRELNTKDYLIRCCFPVTLENVKRVFDGFEIFDDIGGKKSFKPEDLGFPFGDSQGYSGLFEKSDENSSLPDGQPRMIDYSGFRNLKVHSPKMTDYILECWDLSFCKTPIFVSLATDHVWEVLFRNQVKSLIYCFLAVLLAGFMSFVYSDRLSRPIQEITIAAGEICAGKLETRIPEQAGEGEIEKLAHSLDLMAQRLTGRINLANQQLLAEKGRFETLVESTWEGIFLLGGDGRILFANHAGRQLIGSFPDKAEFTEVIKAVGTEFQPILPAPWNPGIGEFKCVFQLPSGSKGNRKILALYIRTCNRSEIKEGVQEPDSGFIAVLRDITVEKEIDRMKSDFVSQVSHELRTPLTSIKAYTEMLLDDDVGDPKNHREYLRITFDEAERLTRLINDLLDIARIESGRRPLKLGEVDLVALSREIAEVIKGQIEKSRQKLTLHLPTSPIFLVGDADLLKQAGLNLLSNASKYTPPEGKIDLFVEKRPDGKLAWRFVDTGIGLSPEDKDRLFDKFFRADSDFVRAAGGTGLGMTLVKNIIDLHQGEILVDSTYQKGSTFTVNLPTGMMG